MKLKLEKRKLGDWRFGPLQLTRLSSDLKLLKILKQLTTRGSGRVHLFTMDRVDIRKAGHVSSCLVSKTKEGGFANFILQELIDPLELQ